MTLAIAGRNFESIAVVDDDPSARESYGDLVAELGMAPYLEQGPINDVDLFLDHVVTQSQAIVCDHHLRKKNNYATSDGNVIMKACYTRKIPAILCTSFSDIDVTLSRAARKFIPVLMGHSEVNPDSIVDGIGRCIREHSGEFSATREQTRTLVRIDDIVEHEKHLYIVVPGWDPVNRIRLAFEDVPDHILKAIHAGTKRLHAEANIGAERPEDLYFDFSKWETE